MCIVGIEWLNMKLELYFLCLLVALVRGSEIVSEDGNTIFLPDNLQINESSVQDFLTSFKRGRSLNTSSPNVDHNKQHQSALANGNPMDRNNHVVKPQCIKQSQIRSSKPMIFHNARILPNEYKSVVNHVEHVNNQRRNPQGIIVQFPRYQYPYMIPNYPYLCNPCLSPGYNFPSADNENMNVCPAPCNPMTCQGCVGNVYQDANNHDGQVHPVHSDKAAIDMQQDIVDDAFDQTYRLADGKVTAIEEQQEMEGRKTLIKGHERQTHGVLPSNVNEGKSRKKSEDGNGASHDDGKHISSISNTYAQGTYEPLDFPLTSSISICPHCQGVKFSPTSEPYMSVCYDTREQLQIPMDDQHTDSPVEIDRCEPIEKKMTDDIRF